jgi:hypothetical protein
MNLSSPSYSLNKVWNNVSGTLFGAAHTRLRIAQIPIMISEGITLAAILCTVQTIPGVDTASPILESARERAATE